MYNLGYIICIRIVPMLLTLYQSRKNTSACSADILCGRQLNRVAQPYTYLTYLTRYPNPERLLTFRAENWHTAVIPAPRNVYTKFVFGHFCFPASLARTGWTDRLTHGRDTKCGLLGRPHNNWIKLMADSPDSLRHGFGSLKLCAMTV